MSVQNSSKNFAKIFRKILAPQTQAVRMKEAAE